jgi:hypothetical protein
MSVAHRDTIDGESGAGKRRTLGGAEVHAVDCDNGRGLSGLSGDRHGVGCTVHGHRHSAPRFHQLGHADEGGVEAVNVVQLREVDYDPGDDHAARAHFSSSKLA